MTEKKSTPYPSHTLETDNGNTTQHNVEELTQLHLDTIQYRDEFIFTSERKEKNAIKKKFIQNMFSRCLKEMMIIDPYFNIITIEEVYQEFKEKVDIKIMVYKDNLRKKPDPKDEYSSLLDRIRLFSRRMNTSRADSVIVKNVPLNDWHDRFIVIDQSEIWIMGNSLEGFGNNGASTIVRIHEPSDLIDYFQLAWKKATIIQPFDE